MWGQGIVTFINNPMMNVTLCESMLSTVTCFKTAQ